jgi:branched-chain amino acid transport system ATP-binding protein
MSVTVSTSQATGDALTIAGLSAGYGRFAVLHGVDLHVGRGEALGLVGPNGAGKTTVIRSIMGMIRHRSGRIRVGETDVITMPTHRIARGHAALAPEGRRLFSELSVEENLMLGATHLRGERDRTTALLDSVYDLFPVLRGYRNRPSTALSGGEQQMVAIGRSLMSDPELLLLDEPSLGLAPLAIEDVIRALLALRERGRSLLIVEQRIDLVLRVCDRINVMVGGRIVLEEEAAAVDRDERAVIDAYLG